MEVLGTSFFFYVDSIIYKLEGQLVKFGDLKLLNLDELLYIFIIQDFFLMIEDMLEEYVEVLVRQYFVCCLLVIVIN